jgi:hypothetical protein
MKDSTAQKVGQDVSSQYSMTIGADSSKKGR